VESVGEGSSYAIGEETISLGGEGIERGGESLGGEKKKKEKKE